MKTLSLSATPADLDRAAALLAAGEVVGMPTETVYGLAADALNPAAVGKIFAAKGRPADNPLIVHIADRAQWDGLVQEIPEKARALADAYWPGPLTVILPRRDTVPDAVTAGLSTVAVRFPAHPVAQELIRRSGCVLAAPSANISGRPSPTTAAHVHHDMDGKIAAVVDGGDCGVGLESTVVAVMGGRVRLLRPGGITPAMLEAVVGAIEIDPAVTAALREGQAAMSPGMKYQHYAPKAHVRLVTGDSAHYTRFVNARAGKGDIALCFEEDLPALTTKTVCYGRRREPASQAHALFDALRRLDEIGATDVWAAAPDPEGIGLAVYNRLLRAAAFEVVDSAAPLLIGLTGASGAGKTTAAAAFEANGVPVIDADKVARSVQTPGSPCLNAVAEAFGSDVLTPSGALDRRALAARAFASPEDTARLNAVTLPYIVREIDRQIAAVDAPVAVLDAPLLFQTGLDRRCCRTVAIVAPESVRLERILARDGVTPDEAKARMAAQPPDDWFRARADETWENTGDPSAIQARVDRLLKEVTPCP